MKRLSDYSSHDWRKFTDDAIVIQKDEKNQTYYLKSK